LAKVKGRKSVEYHLIKSTMILQW